MRDDKPLLDYGNDRQVACPAAAGLRPVVAQFGNLVQLGPWGLRITPEGRPLARMVANMLNAYMAAPTSHSSAV